MHRDSTKMSAADGGRYTTLSHLLRTSSETQAKTTVGTELRWLPRWGAARRDSKDSVAPFEAQGRHYGARDYAELHPSLTGF